MSDGREPAEPDSPPLVDAKHACRCAVGAFSIERLIGTEAPRSRTHDLRAQIVNPTQRIGRRLDGVNGHTCGVATS